MNTESATIDITGLDDTATDRLSEELLAALRLFGQCDVIMEPIDVSDPDDRRLEFASKMVCYSSTAMNRNLKAQWGSHEHRDTGEVLNRFLRVRVADDDDE